MALENVEDLYPLAPMQQLMLMHSVRVHGSSTLTNQFRYRLTGALDSTRFAAAWQQAIARHPALRTAFVWQDIDRPVQIVRTAVPVPWQYIELADAPENERQSRVAELQRSDRERGFDLVQAPLFRLTLIRTGVEEHLLLWSRHHLILDLWSVDILFGEVFACYNNASPDSALPAPGSYRDYIAWLERQDRQLAETFWRDYLQDCAAPTPMFAQRARRSTWSSAGQPAVSGKLDKAHSQRLIELARSRGVTFGSLIQGAVALLIAEHCACDDIIFGMTVSGRPQNLLNVEHTMGSFINNVPVRVRIDPDASVANWLTGLQQAHIRRTPFEYVSPIDIQRWSGLPARLPLFDFLLLVQAPQAAVGQDSGIAIEALPGPYDSALPVTLAVEPGTDGITMTAVYDDAVVTSDEARALLDNLQNVLDRLATHGDATLAEVLECELQPAPRIAGHRDITGVGSAAIDGAIVDDNLQEVLLQIWRHTLGLPDIGLDDDFFALGGTSVQAAIAFTEIERQLGRELPLALLFSAGSVRRLMEELQMPTVQLSSLVGIQPHGSRPPILASSGLGGNVVGLAALARSLGENQPFFGLQSRGLVDDDVPQTTIEEIASEYAAEGAALTNDPYVLLGICFGASVALQMAHELTRQGRPPKLLIVLIGVHRRPAAAARRTKIANLPGLCT